MEGHGIPARVSNILHHSARVCARTQRKEATHPPLRVQTHSWPNLLSLQCLPLLLLPRLSRRFLVQGAHFAVAL